jgi:hypothetical protein
MEMFKNGLFFSFLMYRYSCSCRVCGESSRFIFQWYSEKENSKPVGDRKPIFARGVCADFRHMIEIMANDNPYYPKNKSPQRLVDIETQERQYPDILSLVERAAYVRTNPEALEFFLRQGKEALGNIPGLLRRV